ncbi:MAG: hypothetical protein ACKPKO_49870, partial [Candidatus Fonsibacter sp.]
GATHIATAAKTTRPTDTANTINAIDASDSTHDGLQWCSFFHRHHRRTSNHGAISPFNCTNADADADGHAGPAALTDDTAHNEAVNNMPPPMHRRPRRPSALHTMPLLPIPIK